LVIPELSFSIVYADVVHGGRTVAKTDRRVADRVDRS